MQLHAAVLLALLLLSAATATAAIQHVQQEVELLQHLRSITRRYGKTVIPRLNTLEPVNVDFMLMPKQLVSVDSVDQTLKVVALLKIRWEDELLVWNSSQFGGIEVLHFSRESVWTPEVVVHNAAGRWQVLQVSSDLLLGYVTDDRTSVTAIWQHEFHFTCDFVMATFPKDEQICELQLSATAFMQPLYRIKSRAENVDTKVATSMFRADEEWHLTGFTKRNASIEIQMPNGVLNNISAFEVEISICRFFSHYAIVVVAPLLLLTALQLLTYLVPLESGEKTGCGVTVLLSFTVFLLLIDQIVPKTQHTPAILYFITASMIISAASLVYNCLLLRMHHTSSDTHMPRWFEKVTQLAGRVTCFGGSPGAEDCSSVHCDAANCNKWRVGAAALERLGLALHTVCIVVLVVWLQLQFS